MYSDFAGVFPFGNGSCNGGRAFSLCLELACFVYSNDLGIAALPGDLLPFFETGDLQCSALPLDHGKLGRTDPGSGLCNTDCARQNCRFCRKHGQYKDCYQRYQDFFPFFHSNPSFEKNMTVLFID